MKSHGKDKKEKRGEEVRQEIESTSDQRRGESRKKSGVRIRHRV